MADLDITQETLVTTGPVTGERLNAYESVSAKNRVMELQTGLTLYETELGVLDLLLVKAKLISTEIQVRPDMPEIIIDLERFVGDVTYSFRNGHIIVDSDTAIDYETFFTEIASRLVDMSTYDAAEDVLALIRDQRDKAENDLEAERQKADPDVLELEHRVLIAEARTDIEKKLREDAEKNLALSREKAAQKDIKIAVLQGEMDPASLEGLAIDDESTVEDVQSTLPRKIIKGFVHVMGLLTIPNSSQK